MLKQRFTGIPARVTFPGVSAWSTWSMDFYARAPRNGAGALPRTSLKIEDGRSCWLNHQSPSQSGHLGVCTPLSDSSVTSSYRRQEHPETMFSCHVWAPVWGVVCTILCLEAWMSVSDSHLWVLVFSRWTCYGKLRWKMILLGSHQLAHYAWHFWSVCK